MTEVKVIFFDVYDTLASLRNAVAADLARYEKSADELSRYISDYAKDADEGRISFDAYQEKYSAFFGKSKHYLPLHLLPRLEPIQEMHALVTLLDCKELPIGLLSDVSPQALRQTIVSGRVPYVNYFAIIESNKHGKRKVDGLLEEATLITRERLSIEPQHILLVDDNHRNIDAAKKAGWQAYHFDPHHPRTSVKNLLETYGSI
jgi:FMN phosphatase YigB (HAD superfamily)